MELPQIFRFLHQIWRRPTSERLFSPRLTILYRGLSFFPFLFGVIGVVWLGFASPQLTSTLRSWTIEVISPVFKGLHWVDNVIFKTIPNFLIRWVAAYQHMDNEQSLEVEVLTLKQKLIFLEGENNHLRALLKTTPLDESVQLTSPIIGYLSDLFSQTLIIKGGNTQDLTYNMPVVTPQGLVGKIIEAGPTTSQVLLILDPNFKVPVMIGNKGHYAIAAGDNTNQMKVLYLNTTAEVEEGELVFTSGHGGIFPAGIPVGLISQVKPEIRIHPFISVKSLSFVKVIKPVAAKSLTSSRYDQQDQKLTLNPKPALVSSPTPPSAP